MIKIRLDNIRTFYRDINFYFWRIFVVPVPHLQEERVDSVNEEENEGGRETVSGEQPENPRQVEEEKVDDKAGDKDCGCDERQSHPG